MADSTQYISILLESLYKKEEVLEQLLVLNEKQGDIIKNNMKIEDFEENVEKKAFFIKELEHLDAGFQTVYLRVKEELIDQKLSFTSEIHSLQRMITSITDKSVALETSEKRNKQAVEQYFSFTRNNFQKARKNVKAASDYYKSMSQVNYIDPQLMDQKK
ncbi:MAG TPA: flagellar export chaperone FlgN [Lachnospiraceae bacterium]|nr:flagellar export chaperone FlgN [Lachnospiraceae bacterium]